MLFRPLEDKIVLFGMSCSGKTTFAKGLCARQYHCFDALFQWHLIETLGLSIEANLKHIQKVCSEDRWVLDGWHLGDKEGEFLPVGSTVCVIYSSYQKIIDQYRVPVVEPLVHMYRKWYGINYEAFAGTRYILNDGDFQETSFSHYQNIVDKL